MKIIIVRTAANELSGDTYNLQEIGLGSALVRAGHSCDIVYYTTGDDRFEKVQVKGTDSQIGVFYRKGKNVASDAWFGADVDELLDSYDVVQVCDFDRLYSKHLYSKKQNVVVYHGPYKHRQAGFRGFAHQVKSALFEAFMIRGRDWSKINCLAKSELAESYLRLLGFESARTIGVGFDATKFNDVAPLPKIAKYELLAIGRLHPNKNQLILFDMLKVLKARGLDVHLTIVGSGEDWYSAKVRESASSEDFRHCVTLIEKVAQEEIGAYYARSDLFLLPSTYEIFGMVLLEAGRFCCPVVSSVNGGSSTLISSSEYGWIVNGFSADEWADVVMSALQSTEARESKARALHHRVMTEFTWDALSKQFVQAYESCLADCSKEPRR